MKLGMIIEGYESEDKIVKSLEVENFIPWFAQNNKDTYIINILDEPFEKNQIKARSALDDSLIILNPEELDVVYYGITGQKIYLPNGSLNSLDENLEKITQSLEYFSNYPDVLISNPLDTMVFGLSKDYLIKLQDKGIKVIDTLDIQSVDDLYDLTIFGKDMIVKPKIAERGNGSVIAGNLDTYQKVEEYAKKFLNYEKLTEDNLYSQIRNRQGLIAQEFNPDFITTGEKKIYYVNGSITVSRRNDPPKNSELGNLDFRKGLVEKIYTPTKDETNFVYELAEFLKSENLDFDYFRADIIGNGTKKTIRLNELELINPCSSSGHNPYNKQSFNPHYSKKEVDFHNNSLLNSFYKKVQKGVLL